MAFATILLFLTQTVNNCGNLYSYLKWISVNSIKSCLFWNYKMHDTDSMPCILYADIAHKNLEI